MKQHEFNDLIFGIQSELLDASEAAISVLMPSSEFKSMEATNEQTD